VAKDRKDRARPFSKKHRRYWLTVTGGMLLIGAIDVCLGYLFWPHRPGDDGPPEEIRYDVPMVTGAWATLTDAGVPDAAALPDAPPPPTPSGE
jgi:hypothetical protein